MRAAVYRAPAASHAYCLDLVRRFDNENFLINVLQPAAPARRAHIALRALNVELVQIRARVSNEDLGRARAMFFREGVAAVCAGGAPPAAPALEALAEATGAHPALRAHPALPALVAARADDLAYPAPRALADVETFAGATHGGLAALHAALLAPDDARAGAAAAAAGTAAGLAVLLRGAPAAAASRLSYMPRLDARAAGVPDSALLSGGPAARPVFDAVAGAARRHASAARAQAGAVAAAARPALWTLRVADIYLARLAGAGGDPFDARLQASMRSTYPLRLQLALLANRLLGTV